MEQFLKKQFTPLALLFLLMLAYLGFVFGPVLQSPNSYLFSSSNDGIKNYYTYAYTIKNNHSVTNFEGMNYPYGESMMYTDNHPFLAFCLHTMSGIFPGISSYSIGILNFLMIFSIAIAMWVIFLLLKELKVNPYLAALGAFSICFLSPQIFRLTGHYALSYSFAIPLTIYLLLLVQHNKKGALLGMFFFLLFLFFTHAYLGMIALTLLLSFYGFVFLENLLRWDKPELFNTIKRVFFASLPLAIFYVFVKVTDTHLYRTTNPWGLLENHANINTVFVPVYNSSSFLNNIFFPGQEQLWEGWSYIGFATMLALCLYLFVHVFMILKKKKLFIKNPLVESKTWQYLLLASVVVLLFSMFVPFRFNRLHWLEHVAFLKQFRAIGRFAWAFYYVATITCFVVFNQIFVRLKSYSKWAAYTLVIAVVVSFVLEGKANQLSMASIITDSPNLFAVHQNSSDFQQDVTHKEADYFQAIIPLPYFNIGSENFGKLADSQIYQKTMLFSYHLGLPTFGSYLTRTSIEESKNNMQLLGAYFYPKNIERDIPNKKPYLIVATGDEFDADELQLLEKATLLTKREAYALYALGYDELFASSAKNEWQRFDDKKPELVERNGFLTADSTGFFVFIDFENEAKSPSFAVKNGSYIGTHYKYNNVFQIASEELLPNKKYILRFWMYNQGENFGQDALPGTVYVQKEVNGNHTWVTGRIDPRNSHQILGNWSMVEVAFTTTNESCNYELIIKGNDNNEHPFYVDDLLFYEEGLNVYKELIEEGRTVLFFNNHRIK